METTERNNRWHKKFVVTRVDQRDKPGGDREGAEYLVIDLTRDERAVDMVREYAGLEPKLANSLHLMALRRYGHAYLNWGGNPVISVVDFCGVTAHVIKKTKEWEVYTFNARGKYVKAKGTAASVGGAYDAVLSAFKRLVVEHE